MKRACALRILATLCGLAICGNALAQAPESGAEDIAELKRGQQELRQELTAVKTELQAVRGELKQVLAAVKASQAKQKPTRQPDTKIYDINIGSSPILGPKDAPVTIVEFVDLQCPYCIREHPKIKEVLAAYPKDVRLVFKHFPLRMHTKAKPAHAATVLARAKGNDVFWSMIEKIMAKPRALEVADLRQYAEELGLDLAEFDAVMADEKRIDALLAPDLSESRKCGVRGTPTVLINGLKLASRNIDDYKSRIDSLLADKGKKQPDTGAAKAPEKK